MAYEIYITRAESWVEDENPITLSEVEKVLEKLPRGFEIDQTGVVTTTTPDGNKLSAKVGPYLIYQNEKDSNSRVHIYFNNGVPSFSVREEKYMLPIIELADALNAKVQGDEEEIYTRESILGI